MPSFSLNIDITEEFSSIKERFTSAKNTDGEDSAIKGRTFAILFHLQALAPLTTCRSASSTSFCKEHSTFSIWSPCHASIISELSSPCLSWWEYVSSSQDNTLTDNAINSSIWFFWMIWDKSDHKDNGDVILQSAPTDMTGGTGFWDQRVIDAWKSLYSIFDNEAITSLSPLQFSSHLSTISAGTISVTSSLYNRSTRNIGNPKLFFIIVRLHEQSLTSLFAFSSSIPLFTKALSNRNLSGLGSSTTSKLKSSPGPNGTSTILPWATAWNKTEGSSNSGTRFIIPHWTPICLNAALSSTTIVLA